MSLKFDKNAYDFYAKIFQITGLYLSSCAYT